MLVFVFDILIVAVDGDTRKRCNEAWLPFASSCLLLLLLHQLVLLELGGLVNLELEAPTLKDPLWLPLLVALSAVQHVHLGFGVDVFIPKDVFREDAWYYR